MKKISFITYMSSIAVILMILIYIQFDMNVSEYRKLWDSSCHKVENYQVNCVQSNVAPQGVIYEYRWVLKDIPENGACVTFYSVHNEVQMYVGAEKVYDVKAKSSNAFGKTTGCLWPSAVMTPADNGKYLTIRIAPVYFAEEGADQTFYFGTEQAVFMYILKDNIGVIILGIMSVIIGLLLIALACGYKYTGERENGILMLGVFAVETGLWKLSDMSAATILFDNPLTASAISLISLAAMPTSFILFVRHQFSTAKKPIWDYIALFCSALSVLLVLLQKYDLADFRETLWITHTLIVITMGLVVGLVIWETKHSKWSNKLVVTIMCTCLCIFGMAMDLLVYYLFDSEGNMIFGVAALFIYIIIMACYTIRDTRNLMDIGLEARHFENMAHHDRLTGLYNRMFYEDYVQNLDLNKENSFFIVFDVNNLKTCNDTRGHDCGDVLIKNTSGLIQQVFGEHGVCCRIGGDEFYVVLQGVSVIEVEKWLKELEDLTIQHNQAHPDEFEIRIAYGYARYDNRIDYDYTAAVRRADKMMYEKKTEMKKKK